MGQRINFIHRRPKRARNVRIRRTVESYVRVADLDEREAGSLFSLLLIRPQYFRHRHARRKAPHNARPRPLHALQKSAAVNAVAVRLARIRAILD